MGHVLMGIQNMAQHSFFLDTIDHKSINNMSQHPPSKEAFLVRMYIYINEKPHPTICLSPQSHMVRSQTVFGCSTVLHPPLLIEKMTCQTSPFHISLSPCALA